MSNGAVKAATPTGLFGVCPDAIVIYKCYIMTLATEIYANLRNYLDKPCSIQLVNIWYKSSVITPDGRLWYFWHLKRLGVIKFE
jgi:hypothetical protein